MNTYTTMPTVREAEMWGCDAKVYETTYIDAGYLPRVAVATCTFEDVIGIFVAGDCTPTAKRQATQRMRDIGHHSGSIAEALYAFMSHYTVLK